MIIRQAKVERALGALASASCLAISLPMTAAAQTPTADDEIVVTATRIDRPLNQIPGAVTVIDQDTIQLNRQQLALDESLNRVPGVFTQARYNFSRDVRVSIRGFGARANFGIRGIKIIVDGIPETTPDGQGGVDGIDLASTGRIEVLRGPSASMWGNHAGGVINITTETPPPEGFTEVRLTGGAYDFQKVQLKTGAQRDAFSYLISVTDSEYDGYREHSYMENTQLTGRFTVDLGDGRELSSVLSYTDQPRSDDPGAVDAAAAASNPRAAYSNNLNFNAGESQEKTRLGIAYSMPLADGHSIEARAFTVSRDFENFLPFGGDTNGTIDTSFVGAGVNYRFDANLGGKPNRFLVGLDIEDQDDHRRRYLNLMGVRGSLQFNQNEIVESIGVFAQNDIDLTDAVTLSFGLRADEMDYRIQDHFVDIADNDFDDSSSISLDDVSEMLGVTADLSGSLTLYGTYATSFEGPTTTELFLPDGTSGGLNSNLEPQSARNLEFGLRGLIGGNSSYDIAVFDIEVDDELVPYPTPIDGRSYYVNAGKSSRRGIEFSYSASISERLSTSLSYTWSDFEFDTFIESDGDNFSGNVIPGIPEDLLFAELIYREPNGLFAAFDILHVGEQYADNGNGVLVDSYTVGNLRVGYDRVSGSMTISPFIGISNLFDESYPNDVRINAFGGRFYDPAPDRHLYAGVRIRFGG